MAQPEYAHIERFREAIALRLGLAFDQSRSGFLAEVFQRRLGASSFHAEAYLAALESGHALAEVTALAQELTVAETYFFRNRDQYRALAEVVIPNRIAVRPGARALRILSAGCASGEEAYSLAIVAGEAVDATWQLSVIGVDANPVVIARALRARYSTWALRETPIAEQERWFKADGREFVLDERVRSAVKFEVRNLVDDDPQLWQPGSYDVVFFRNVLMYFTPENARAAVARVAGALKPGGYLFLGHAETLRGLSGDFGLEHTHETFYYRRKDVLGSAMPDAPRLEPPARYASPAVDAPGSSSTTWIDAIGDATRRIELLTTGATARPWSAPHEAEHVTRPSWDKAHTLDLLRQERFAEALDTMPLVATSSQHDPDLLLVSAALHVHRGQFEAAEEACGRLLELDELSAGAHYLLALCRDGAADPVRAAHHDQLAIYLDAKFAMPHVHLGLMAGRAGDRAAAQRELSQALPLLEHEDASRLLLYGGGFSRDALLALCRAELAGAGAHS